MRRAPSSGAHSPGRKIQEGFLTLGGQGSGPDTPVTAGRSHGSGRNPLRRGVRMRKTLLVVIAGLLAVGAGLYVVVVRPVMAPSEEAPIAERALVKPDVVLLAEVNVKQAVFLEKWFLGSPVFDSA